MATLTETDQKLILAFIDKKFTLDELLSKLEYRPESGAALSLSLLRLGYMEKDPVAVEMGTMLMYRLGITGEYREILRDTARERLTDLASKGRPEIRTLAKNTLAASP